MSINSLTNDELKRQKDFRARVTAKGIAFAPAVGAADRGMAEVAVQDNQVTGTLNALVKYIPTEIVTLYVAAVSATPALRASFSFLTNSAVYWAFVVLTPLLLLLVYASKRATDGLPALPPFAQWPWWKLAAATIAFLVWALAVPGNPYIVGDGGAVVAGFGAVLISTALSLLEPIFDRPRPPAG
jgi:hypothetical protein